MIGKTNRNAATKLCIFAQKNYRIAVLFLRSCIMTMAFVVGVGLYGIAQTEHHVFRYANGTPSSEGLLRDRKPDGYWKTFHENGQLKSEGNRKDFLLDGTWYFYSETGDTTLIVNYQNGLKNGSRFIFLSDAIVEEPFVNDMKSGQGHRLDKKHRKLQIIPYKNGYEEGFSPVFDTMGVLKEIISYKRGYVNSREVVNRCDENGLKHGYWKSFYPDWTLHTEMYYRHGKRDGLFKEYDEKGNLCKVKKFIDDVEQLLEGDKPLHFKREYYSDGKVRREASFRDNKREGVWREYDENGRVIASQTYKNGLLIDNGIVDTDGRRQGFYQEFFPDSTLKTNGLFVDGLKSGRWTYYYQNEKEEQSGVYVEGQPDGEWKWFHDNGQLARVESYLKGVLEGVYKEYDSQGRLIVSGTYFDGMKVGKWVEQSGNVRSEGEYRNDRKSGEWVSYFDNGKMAFRGTFNGGFPDGKHIYYYSNGKMRELETYAGGIRHGAWKKYLDTGELFFEITYIQGVERKYDGEKIDEEDIVRDGVDK